MSHWYCRTCKESKEPGQITFQEECEDCGTDADWIEDGPGMVEIAPPFSPPKGSFQHELVNLINKHSIEGGSDTPDFILAEYLRCCLDSFDMVTRRRDEWFKPENKIPERGFCIDCQQQVALHPYNLKTNPPVMVCSCGQVVYPSDKPQ